MTTLVVPPLDAKPWPTLGPQVCDFISDYLVHGPGDLRGEPARFSDEFRALVYRTYEVFPRDHPQAGRRRFKRVAWSLRKGTAKTEKAAWICATELHQEGPVRCDGWRKEGRTWVPVGAPVRDPYIPMVAYTEEQTEELAYGALYVILSEGPLADDFDIGLDRIMRKAGDGKASALASSPNSRDGARTTCQHFDETHRMVLPRLRQAHQTMQANIPKRKIADAWSLETTTAPRPGENSVAEGTMDYAHTVLAGKFKDSKLFFFHREAGPEHDISQPAGLRDAIVDASGPEAEWSDIDGIAELWNDPQNEREYLERVYLNRVVKGADQAFDPILWADLTFPVTLKKRELVVLGFDGARFRDSTALVATGVKSGHQHVVGLWERPANAADGWEVDASDVDATVARSFDTWKVLRFYADPPMWDDHIDAWIAKYGEKVVHAWWTNRPKPMAFALKAYVTAMQSGEVSHDGDGGLARHIGNAYRRRINVLDERGERMWTIQKDRPDSLNKIDAAMAACLSWEARGDVIAAGALKKSGRGYGF